MDQLLFETYVSVCHKIGVGRCNLEKSIVRRGLTLYYDAISKQKWKESPTAKKILILWHKRLINIMQWLYQSFYQK
jgi:hypothetical protein